MYILVTCAAIVSTFCTHNLLLNYHQPSLEGQCPLYMYFRRAVDDPPCSASPGPCINHSQSTAAVDTADPIFVIKNLREGRRRTALNVLNLDHIFLWRMQSVSVNRNVRGDLGTMVIVLKSTDDSECNYVALRQTCNYINTSLVPGSSF